MEETASWRPHSTATTDSRSRRQVESRTLREQVLDQLREDILSGELSAGTVLGEVALAESFGVSRGPIREALSRLSSEGLVTIEPRRGAEVASLTREDFLDAYQVREALETLAIRLAVPRLTDEDRGELRRLHEAMVGHAERDEVRDFFEANTRFHQIFVAASNNRKLEEFYRLLIGQMGRYLARSLALRGTIQRSVAEHSAILEAVESGDADRAARLLAEHIEVPQRELDGATAEPVDEPGAAADQPSPA